MTDRNKETEVSDLAWLLEAVGSIWAIRPELLSAIVDMRRRGASAESMREAAAQYMTGNEAAAGNRLDGSVVGGGVAVIPLKGILTPNVSLLAMLFGMGSGLQRFRETLHEAVGNEEVTRIVLDIDSPGGLVDLVPETSAEVRAANSVKPITAVANTLAASGAYWIASQADEIVVTPSGEVGSIGVFTEHWDLSAALEAFGEKPTLISAGKYKTEGNPYEPLDDQAKEALQKGVDDFYGLFVKDVAKGRGGSVSEVKAGYGQGRVLTAKRAVEANLADRVEPIEGTIARLTSKPASSSSARARGLLGDDDTHPIAAIAPETEAVEPEYTSDELRRVVDTLATPQH